MCEYLAKGGQQYTPGPWLAAPKLHAAKAGLLALVPLT